MKMRARNCPTLPSSTLSARTMAAKVTATKAMKASIPIGFETGRCRASVTRANSATICTTPSMAGVSQPASVVRIGRRTAVRARRESGRTSRKRA
jgi:septum formation inhibitor-activating ATPase MinD